MRRTHYLRCVIRRGALSARACPWSACDAHDAVSRDSVAHSGTAAQRHISRTCREAPAARRVADRSNFELHCDGDHSANARFGACGSDIHARAHTSRVPHRQTSKKQRSNTHEYNWGFATNRVISCESELQCLSGASRAYRAGAMCAAVACSAVACSCARAHSAPATVGCDMSLNEASHTAAPVRTGPGAWLARPGC